MNFVKRLYKKLFNSDNQSESRMSKAYLKRYLESAFTEGDCKNIQQYEACITRLYHTIEKGLAYLEYRPGFGRDNVKKLVDILYKYVETYDKQTFFYQTALSVLHEYVKKNKEYGYSNEEQEKRINSLSGAPNTSGGILAFTPLTTEELRSANFETLILNRHSIRHFSDIPVSLEKIKKALALAQHTPSACNRQGWRTRIISNKKKIEAVLKNQNGNRGFGQEFDKLLVVTSDLRYFNRERELFQGYIDGGMYAMNLLNGLYYEGIGSVPLSASLSEVQEESVRKILNIDNAEILILFIGVGNYPDICQTTKSERKDVEFIEL